MAMAADDLVALMTLERTDEATFLGHSPQVGWQRVYGGLVVAQALAAAVRTVEAARRPHSLHAHFLLPGDPGAAIAYHVTSLRDGGSFSTRRVEARQHGRLIFVATVSFQKPEADFLSHRATMPDVPPPEDLPDEETLLGRFAERMPENMRRYFSRPRPVSLRFCEPWRLLAPQRPLGGPRRQRQHVWIRASRPLGDDGTLHLCALAYASDMTLLDTALVPHGRNIFDRDIMMASLDHALWIHAPLRADEWLLFAQDSPVMAGGRALARGLVFARDGRLVAATAQEGLIRPQRRRPDPAASRW